MTEPFHDPPVLGVVVPTVTGREDYLERCIRGYKENTPADIKLKFYVPKDCDTCGIAWQEGAESFGRGIEPPDFLHFTADDIVPAPGWFDPCVGACARGNVPIVGVVTPLPEMLDGDGYPRFDLDLSLERISYFEDQSIKGPDWFAAPPSDSYYPSIPFFTWEQWKLIGPSIASHYGTDKWLGYRAKLANLWPVLRTESLFWHYSAHPGRKPKAEGWYHLDRLNFELNIAYPMYVNGQLAPHETHPAYGTEEGKHMARLWYAQNVPHADRYWERPM